MNSFVKKYAGIALASTVVIGGIASAAITPIPTISNTFAVAGQKILSADINKLAEALNILDTRTKWVDVPLTDTAPFDINCEYRTKESRIKSSNANEDGSVLAFFAVDNTNGFQFSLLMRASDKTKLEEWRNQAFNTNWIISGLQRRCE